MRKQIAAANWKMNQTFDQANKLMTDFLAQPVNDLNNNRLVVFGIPFPYLTTMQTMIKGKSSFFLAAQNCSDKKNGAYTGETSAEMLASIDVPFVILGHSERREYFLESNASLAEKVNICLGYGLKPIFCCGEPLAIREAATQNTFVESQLKESLFHLSAEQSTGFVIAYEPIWAIGTGKTASSEQAQEMHAQIRSVFAKQYGDVVANSISILYGGSVKAANAKEIFGQPDVDGGLVGGASLNAVEFAAIVNSLK